MDAQAREITLDVPLAVPRERAWQALAHEMPTWWPSAFLCFPESERIRFEPWAGGRLWEETPDGRQVLWATSVLIVPGEAIELVGHTTPTFGGPNVTMVRLALEDGSDGSTILRLKDTILGRCDDAQAANIRQGWSLLYEQAFKEYVESAQSREGSVFAESRKVGHVFGPTRRALVRHVVF